MTSKIISYLSTELHIPTYAEKPSNKVDEYIVVRTIDDGRINHINASTFYIEAYSTTNAKASELIKKVKNAMLGTDTSYGFNQFDEVSSCKLGGGGQNIDQKNKSYCYEAIFNIFYY